MSRQPPPWLWWNVFSLDAPTIAVLWQGFLAQSTGLPLRLPGRLALGLTVWAIYVADRLLDIRHPSSSVDTERHRFYQRHTKALSGLLAVIVAVDVLVIFLWLRPAVFMAGLMPLLGVGVYLGLFHGRRFALPKELIVAFLFTAGTFVVAESGSTQLTKILIWPAGAFFALCLANLVAIETWESRELSSRKTRQPNGFIRFLGRWYLAWVPGLAVLCFAHGQQAWYLAAGLSAAFCALIYWAAPRASLELRRTLVDVALLTPVLFLR